MRRKIRIGTRGSRLALAQTQIFSQALRRISYEEKDLEIVPILTSGDRLQHHSLKDRGGKGLFVKELEQALLEGMIDVAVHSMKDLESHQPDALTLGCVLEREDPRDVFISYIAPSLEELPQGAVVGTCSPRRAAFAAARRPDLYITSFRGNIDTRMLKLEHGEVQGTFLAYAGLKRLGCEERATYIYSVEEMLPAPAQGALAIECRKDDRELLDLLQPLNHIETFLCTSAERAFLKRMGGDCHTPLAAYARLEQNHLFLKAYTAHSDGTGERYASACGPMTQAEGLGIQVAEQLLSEDG